MLSSSPNLWVVAPSESFAVRTEPLPGELLYGFGLRSDIENGFPLGSTMTEALRYRTSWRTISVGSWASGVPFDLGLLATLTRNPVEEVERTTFLPALRRYTGMPSPDLRALGGPLKLAMCPACIRDDALVRQEVVLPNVGFCSVHLVELLKTCTCGASLFPPIAVARLEEPSDPRLELACSACSLPWRQQPIHEAAGDDRAIARDLAHAYASLLRPDGTKVRRRGQMMLAGARVRLGRPAAYLRRGCRTFRLPGWPSWSSCSRSTRASSTKWPTTK